MPAYTIAARAVVPVFQNDVDNRGGCYVKNTGTVAIECRATVSETGYTLGVGSSIKWTGTLYLYCDTAANAYVDTSVGASFDADAVAGQILAQGLAVQMAQEIKLNGTPAIRKDYMLLRDVTVTIPANALSVDIGIPANFPISDYGTLDLYAYAGGAPMGNMDTWGFTVQLADTLPWTAQNMQQPADCRGWKGSIFRRIPLWGQSVRVLLNRDALSASPQGFQVTVVFRSATLPERYENRAWGAQSMPPAPVGYADDAIAFTMPGSAVDADVTFPIHNLGCPFTLVGSSEGGTPLPAVLFLADVSFGGRDYFTPTFPLPQRNAAGDPMPIVTTIRPRPFNPISILYRRYAGSPEGRALLIYYPQYA